MEPLSAISPRTAFDRHARLTPEEERRLREELRQWQAEALQAERTKRLKREHDEEIHREAELLQAVQMLLATPERIAAFTVRLDRYDAATVEALLANDEELRVVGERIDEALDQAVELPDGRRVFKTLDGTRVFDEHGEELSPDQIDPAAIPDYKKAFEPYWSDVQQRRGLEAERIDLHRFQQKLDDARNRLDDADLTDDALDDLERDIDAAMPKRVRRLAGDRLDPTATPDDHDEADTRWRLSALGSAQTTGPVPI